MELQYATSFEKNLLTAQVLPEFRHFSHIYPAQLNLPYLRSVVVVFAKCYAQNFVLPFIDFPGSFGNRRARTRSYPSLIVSDSIFNDPALRTSNPIVTLSLLRIREAF